MKTILTIQHTQSIHHTNGMVGSWTDWDLTETGKDRPTASEESFPGNCGAKTLSCIPLIWQGRDRRRKSWESIWELRPY